MSSTRNEMDDLREQALRHVIEHRATTAVGDSARMACLLNRWFEADVEPKTALMALGCDHTAVTNALCGKQWDLLRSEIMALRLEWLDRHAPEVAEETRKAHGLTVREHKKRSNRHVYRARVRKAKG